MNKKVKRSCINYNKLAMPWPRLEKECEGWVHPNLSLVEWVTINQCAGICIDFEDPINLWNQSIL